METEYKTINGEKCECRKYELVMKKGTLGTLDDPHRPEIIDLLNDKNHDITVDESNNVIIVSCSADEHAKLELTQKRITDA